MITRTLNESGKTVCRINGSIATVGMLKEISEDLIDIYGQHEHQSFLNNAENRIITRDCAENLAVLHIIQRNCNCHAHAFQRFHNNHILRSFQGKS